MMRRAIRLVCLSGAAVAVLAFAASMGMVTWRSPRDLRQVVALWGGMLRVSNGGSYTAPGLTVGSWTWRVRWWPDDGQFWSGYGGSYGRCELPLWMPAVGFGLGAAATWKRRRRPGACVECGYDLAGVSGKCPECGAGPANR